MNGFVVQGHIYLLIHEFTFTYNNMRYYTCYLIMRVMRIWPAVRGKGYELRILAKTQSTPPTG